MNQQAKTIDWIKFIAVMVVFIIGMVFLLLYHIRDPWIWIGYVGLWTWVEMKIAKNIHLTWWVWGLILLGLTAVDLILIDIIH